MAREDCAAFIARDESRQAVGFLIGRMPVVPNGVAEVFNIGVLATVRRAGIGNRLLAEFVEHCRSREVSEVWLEARASNREAINFYETNHFVANGIRPNFYDNPREDAQLMTLKLASE